MFGHRLAQAFEPLPGVLVQEAQRDVERRPAPALEREQPRHRRRAIAGAAASMSKLRIRVASSDWWASRSVVSVSATGCLGPQRRRELGRAELEQALSRPRRRLRRRPRPAASRAGRPAPRAARARG